MRQTETNRDRWRHRLLRAGMAGVSLLLLCGLLLTDIAPVAEAARPGRDRAGQERITPGETREAAPQAARRDVGTEIVGGDVVPQGRYQFTTYIVATVFVQGSPSPFVQTCTGSLIDPLHVLTAAQCVEFRVGEEIIPIPAAGFQLFIGQSSRLSVPAANTFLVAEIFKPDAFDPETLDFDIAVLRLTEPVPASIAQPVTMVDKGDTRFEAPGQSAIAAGWGLTAVGMGTFDLMQMTTSVISDAVCNDIPGGAGIDATTAFCARVPAKSVCVGDTGGPLFVLQSARQAQQGSSAAQAGDISAEGKKSRKRKKRKKRKQRKKQRRNRATIPLLIGVTSFEVASCSLGSPNGFTRLSSPVIHDFVTDAIASN